MSDKKRFFFILFILSVICLLIKFVFLAVNSTAFTYDQGRDLLDLREMFVLGKIRLIGANTSLHGVFYGPLWYWLGLPFYLLLNGNPLSFVGLSLTISFIMPFLVFSLVDNKKIAFLLSIFYIFSNIFFRNSVYAFNPNPIIFIIPLIVLGLWRFIRGIDNKSLLWISFLIGATFHFEPVVAIFLIPAVIVDLLYYKKVRLVFNNIFLLAPFFLTLIPQIIFDLRHDFLQSKALLTLAKGEGSSLTKGPDLLSRLTERIQTFMNSYLSCNGENRILSLLILGIILLFIYFILKKRNEYTNLFITIFIFLVVYLIGYILFPYALWPWYLNVLDALFMTLIGLAISFFIVSKGKIAIFSGVLMISFMLVNGRLYTPLSLKVGYNPDAALLSNRVEVVDLIYSDNKGEGMDIFTFAPYVYDFPYQYLIWWRARTKYHYLPEQYYYLPNQPDYVNAKSQADKLIPFLKSECTYLIIEPFESQEALYWDWRYRFPESQTTWNIGKTRIEKLCK